MAPAQPFMEADQDCKPFVNPKVELVDDDTEIRRASLPNSASASASEGKHMASIFDIDIIQCTSNQEQPETDHPDADATDEYSTSFADTTSDTGTFSGFCEEGEVQSHSFEDNTLTSAFDAFASAFQTRKKKLTNHWRNFIRPVMWRCNWMELRIKEIETQALKYSRDLGVAYGKKRHTGLDQFPLEEFGSKSLPYCNQFRRKKAMKRRKRKRVEDTTDIAPYISNHNVFSYLENKRSDHDGTSVADDFSNAVISGQSADYNDKLSSGDNWAFFEYRDGGKPLEHVLWKIETVHSRVHKLKYQMDVVMSKNAARFSSSENLSVLVSCDAQSSSAHSPALSPGTGDTISAGAIYTSAQHVSDYNVGDLAMPESVVSSFVEGIIVPDIIESTVGLPSAVDVTFHQPQFGDSSEDIVDNVLIHNEAAEAEKHTLQMINNQPKEEHEQPEKDIHEAVFPTPQSDPAPSAEAALPQEQSTLESCLASDVSFPRNKRKRGERKAGSVVWSKKCSGEPDSQ
ncbi:uncharacterized protein LOC103930511 [Pyrus x bretschneideri]|uniref:uncharacterized protein LOC103930511 n=1 Tax=Pyrus x bretschneideri TaxID=225117 RepID=UPI00202F0A56|nr:uncharacterized protein LOC103930511 [Pyrus x bretschneideri]